MFSELAPHKVLRQGRKEANERVRREKKSKRAKEQKSKRAKGQESKRAKGEEIKRRGGVYVLQRCTGGTRPSRCSALYFALKFRLHYLPSPNILLRQQAIHLLVVAEFPVEIFVLGLLLGLAREHRRDGDAVIVVTHSCNP